MGRKSLAQKLLEEASEEEDEDHLWLVFYDFKGRKPNPRFWKNLNRLLTLLDNGSMVQYSVLKTRQRRGAVAAVRLARHYGAEVKVFKGEEIDIT